MIRRVRSVALLTCLLSLSLFAQTDQGRLRFRVTLDPALGNTRVSGRLIVFITDNPKPMNQISPGFGDELKHTWFAAKEITDLTPGSTVELDPDEIAFPAPLSQAPKGDYQAMALLDVDHNAAYRTFTTGDLESEVVPEKGLNPAETQPVELKLTRRFEENKPAAIPKGAEALDFVSPSLSKFWGRPMQMRGFVVLPPGYDTSKERYPTVYVTHGFGALLNNLLSGSVTSFLTKMANGRIPPMIYVVLDETCSGGTHEFADSVNNGPWGQALTTELIPYLEKKYRMDARPSGRFLTGHSSGGWATMWVQVAYPTVFGGTWPTSPDPVDFRDFTNVDLTKDTNLYKKADGTVNPLVRMDGKAVETIKDYAQQEAVLGDYGGQFASFEWVFSPRGADGRPIPMFDRKTGEINRNIADDWEQKFDVSRKLRTNAKELVPVLKGKIHVIVGTQDTFYLDGAVRLLEKEIQPLGYSAKFTFLEGRTHFDLYQGGLDEKIAKEMYDVARPGNTWKAKAVQEHPAQ